MQLDDHQRAIVAAVDEAAECLVALSHEIHRRPELGHNEVYAAGLLADTLQARGFQVERNFTGLPTAFCARKGRGGRTVAFCAEYDALPEIGHACGHNIIATSALAAGIGLGAVLEEVPGTVLVVGTPAEESDGAKAVMVARGAFAGVDAALMIHPFNGNYSHCESLALRAIQVSFFGRPAHAAMAPWDGRNALDALILTFTSVNALRQHVRPYARIHGIITKGGVAPGIVPDHTVGRFYIRAPTRSYRQELVERFCACAQAAAAATGTRVEFEDFENCFDDMVNNTPLAERVRDYMVENLGAGPFGRAPDSFGSIDMGNVSYVVPAVHLLIDINESQPFAPHTREFAAAAVLPPADEAMLRAGKGMALAGYDVLTDDAFFEAVQADFEHAVGHRPHAPQP